MDYTVTGSQLPAATTFALYWAPSQSFTNMTLAAGPFAAEPEVGDHGRVILDSSLTAPPPGTGYLLLVVDPNDTIVEPNGNNIFPVRVIIPPTVELSFVVNGSPVEDGLKGEAYHIVAKIVNNDIEPITADVRWAEQYTSSPHPREPNGEGLLGPVSVPHEVYLSLGSFTHTWQWIPAQSPVQANKETLNNLVEALATDLPINNSGNTLPSEVGLFVTILDSIITELQAHALADPTVQVTYAAVVDWGGSPVSVQQTITLHVPESYQRHLADYAALNIAAALDTEYAIPLLTFLQPQYAVDYLASEIGLLGAANEAYQQALDPLDPNYTVLVTPQPLMIPEVDSSPDSVLKEQAQLSLDLQAWKVAEGASLNRAAAAGEADDLFWESNQLIAAAGYASKVSAILNRLAEINTLLAPFAATAIAPHIDTIVPYLQANGLPELEVRYLTQLGWTPSQIEGLRDNLVQLGPTAVQTPGLASTALTISALASAFDAIDDLQSAIHIRVDKLGQPVQDVTIAERQNLNAIRGTIAAGLSGGIPAQSLLGSIEVLV